MRSPTRLGLLGTTWTTVVLHRVTSARMRREAFWARTGAVASRANTPASASASPRTPGAFIHPPLDLVARVLAARALVRDGHALAIDLEARILGRLADGGELIEGPIALRHGLRLLPALFVEVLRIAAWGELPQLPRRGRGAQPSRVILPEWILPCLVLHDDRPFWSGRLGARHDLFEPRVLQSARSLGGADVLPQALHVVRPGQHLELLVARVVPVEIEEADVLHVLNGRERTALEVRWPSVGHRALGDDAPAAVVA